MSSVTNQLPYIELKPLPVPKEICPRLRTLIHRVVIVFAMTSCFTPIGFVLGFTTRLFSILNGTLLVGMAGLVVGIVLAILTPIPPKIGEYRIETLKQLEGVLGTARALRAIHTLKQFFSYPFTGFIQCFHHHIFHNELTAITLNLPQDRPDVVKVWEAFLTHLDQTSLKNPDGEEVTLDMSLEFQLLKEKQSTFECQWLNSRSRTYDEDLNQIETLQLLGFGKSQMVKKEQLQEILTKNKKSGCVVARDKETQVILGFIWFFENEGKIEIGGLARQPGAAHLNIGNQLLYTVLNHFWFKTPICVKMRQSNPALNIFTGWGFTGPKELPQYYTEGPPENGILLEMDWNKYQEKVQNLNASA